MVNGKKIRAIKFLGKKFFTWVTSHFLELKNFEGNNFFYNLEITKFEKNVCVLILIQLYTVVVNNELVSFQN